MLLTAKEYWILRPLCYYVLHSFKCFNSLLSVFFSSLEIVMTALCLRWYLNSLMDLCEKKNESQVKKIRISWLPYVERCWSWGSMLFQCHKYHLLRNYFLSTRISTIYQRIKKPDTIMPLLSNLVQIKHVSRLRHSLSACDFALNWSSFSFLFMHS